MFVGAYMYIIICPLLMSAYICRYFEMCEHFLVREWGWVDFFFLSFLFVKLFVGSCTAVLGKGTPFPLASDQGQRRRQVFRRDV